LRLTIQFAEAVKIDFDSRVSLQISVLSEPRRVQTVDNWFVQESMDGANKEATVLETDNLVDITENVWNRAGYVDVVMRPLVKTKESQFAMIEYKGLLPLTATFYHQCGLERISAQDRMASLNPDMVVGDGYASNMRVRPSYAMAL
jgi:hypothetical protein